MRRRRLSFGASLLFALLACREPTSVVEGVASYYGDDFRGKATANGEIYDERLYTAAHRTLPFDTRVRVVNLANDRAVWVRINDRGPFVEGRVIDLSLAAARQLQMVSAGTTKVKLEIHEKGSS